MKPACNPPVTGAPTANAGGRRSFDRHTLRRNAVERAAALLLAPWCLATGGLEVHAAPQSIRSHNFTLPPGFVIEEAAGTNFAPRPVNGSFDDQGRLYVTDSSGSNLPPSEQLKNPTHRVLRLEDTDGDGRFDRSVVFAEKVMFPQGCLWHAGSVYVAGPPSIWKFTDTNGDGVADRREEWFKGGTLTGCANDIHGPHLGPEGYLYWTKGAFAEQTHTLWNGRQLNDRAAHILRAKPDGSGLDVIMSGGMDNPVEVAFTAEGETVFTSTFIDFSQPGWRDGIAHAAYGAVFGKENDVLEDGRVKRTGPELTHPFVQFGAGAPSGLCRYQSDSWGAEYQDNLFASTFNLHKITRHQLRPSGATYASTDSDFLVSDNLDFHPTDVLEDADGSLLVVDTGGWYKLCCPSSQLAKTDVLGGIYRVRRLGTPGLPSTARADAYRRLAQPPRLRENAPEVALKRAALQANPAAAPRFRETLARHAGTVSSRAESGPLVRVAAEGLGRLGDNTAAADLFAALAACGETDPVLYRSLTHALIQIGDTASARAQLKSTRPIVLQAALTALDQAGGGALQPEDVLPHLAARDAALRRTASWIAARHGEWGGALAGSFRQRLSSTGEGEAERAELSRQLGQFARDAAVRELLGSVAADAGRNDDTRRLALQAMAGSGLKEAPSSWVNALVTALTGGRPDLRRQAVATAKAIGLPKKGSPELAAALQQAGRSADLPADTRLEALAAVPGGLGAVDDALFQFMVSGLAPSQPVAARAAAATGLTRARLTDAQLTALAGTVREIGPLELPKVLAAFERSSAESIGLKLVESLKDSKGLSGLRPESLRPRLTNFPEVVRVRAEALLAGMNPDAAKQSARLEALLAEVHGQGDVRRGQAIFNSAKTACAACHAIGYLGGKVGPDLTRISEIRSERDLLEAIVFPSASFVRSYEPVLVSTRDGEEHSGVLRKDGADEVILATGPATEVRLARADIVEMRPGSVSVMPQGLDEQLSRQELADLLAFLRNTRWGPR